jgi:hypothetical protein
MSASTRRCGKMLGVGPDRTISLADCIADLHCLNTRADSRRQGMASDLLQHVAKLVSSRNGPNPF